MKGIALALAAAGVALGAAFALASAAPARKQLVCPVMKNPIRSKAKAPKLVVNRTTLYFCCAGCAPEVKKNPAKYIKQALKDPVSGGSFKLTTDTPKMEYHGALFLFASQETHDAFAQDPEKHAK